MNMIQSLLGANVAMISIFVVDAVLILTMVGFLLWYVIKNSKKTTVSKKDKVSTNLNSDVEKINDDTYVLAKEEVYEPEEVEPVQPDNAVEHFSNQLAGINEPASTELKSNAVIVNHEVEQPVKKVVKKEEINNFVMIDGVKKQKTESEKEQSFNRGTNAFKNSTNFLNSIKEASNTETEKKAAKKTTKK